MNLPFFVAKKYFLSKKKRSFINFISIISMLGIALGLMSLIIILSVFNGLEDLNRQIFKAFDPDLKITSTVKKGFYPNSDLIQKIKTTPGVDFVTEVYKDKALARSKDAQMIVVLKGVDSTFTKNTEMKKSLIEGSMVLKNGGRPMAYIGGGVYSILDLSVEDYLRPLVILYPKNQKINVLNPEDNINQTTVEVSGVFNLEQQYDNYVYLPLETVEELIESPGKRTSLEITLKKNANVDLVKSELKKFLGKDMQIKDRDEQNESLLKAIKIEKFFIFIALFFIIGIASFNIFYALSMLVIDKKDDIETLSSIGASKSLIRNIFLAEGFVISLVGISVGLVLGLGVCLIQMKYGIVSLGMQYATVDAYPVKLLISDILYSVVGIFLITLLASLVPATKALKFMLNQKI
ncbi:ABC transporter permease [Lacihabitans sp. LS3-19]|uniref:ABC transporter permease n=1 Tax=Lacihabitans sp. LS3-19 TaxID=2487335 RepID=UPI0020CDEF29|nr:ABC transporter permease [Lacihabitans sp. LS3-19]MCP9770852.1 ABC transporter permease [Lacihabitans sp. LS3-19]